MATPLRPAAPATGEAAGWLQQEPPIGARIADNARRLALRGARSWRWWLGAALLASVAFTSVRALKPQRYSSTVVLLVSEGTLAGDSTKLSPGSVRRYVLGVAFTSRRLIELMQRHPNRFRGLATDLQSALEDFRHDTDVTIEEMGMVEERGRSDPPRTARVAITFHAADPQLAWTIATELAAMLKGSALTAQAAAADREQAAARSALEAVIAEVGQGAGAADAPDRMARVQAARDRLAEAQRRAVAAGVLVRGIGADQVLRFEVLDPGRPPPAVDRVTFLATSFLTALAIAAVAAWLLAGAFDGRVLDADDLTALGTVVLGRVPPLPAAARRSAARSPSGGRRPRV